MATSATLKSSNDPSQSSQESVPDYFAQTPGPVYTNMNDYCKALSVWVEQQRSMLLSFYHYQALTNGIAQNMQAYAVQCATQQLTEEKKRQGYNVETTPTIPAASAPQVNVQPPVSFPVIPPRRPNVAQPAAPGPAADAEAQDPDMPIQGRRYILPSPWRRVAAEVIDYILLLLFKIGLALVINRDLSLRQIAENIDLDLRYLSQKSATFASAGSTGFGAANRYGAGAGGGGMGGTGRPMPTDLNPFDLMSPEIIIAELLNRVFITLFETVCLFRGIRGRIGGSTPGKWLLGLRVVSCLEVYDLPGRVEVVPANNPGFLSALIRSVIKNFAMVFFFPICLTTLFFQHHRATYDIIAGTVVVQDQVRRVIATNAAPATNAQPATNAAPATNAQPSTNAQPATDAQPSTSAQPAMDAQPVTNAQPSTSAQPAMDAQPSTSAQPVTNAQPSTSAQPTMDAQPSTSAQPAMDAQPSTSAQPEENLQTTSNVKKEESNLPEDNASVNS